jgi:hypothetical protein
MYATTRELQHETLVVTGIWEKQTAIKEKRTVIAFFLKKYSPLFSYK